MIRAIRGVLMGAKPSVGGLHQNADLHFCFIAPSLGNLLDVVEVDRIHLDDSGLHAFEPRRDCRHEKANDAARDDGEPTP